jgi:hypothetical protein
VSAHDQMKRKRRLDQTSFGRTSFVSNVVLLSAVCSLLCLKPAQAANHYVRAGASGNGSGSDWANACTGFTGFCAVSALVRGDTYYVASGSYSGPTFSTPDSGTSLISIIGATKANSGGVAGWNNSYSVSAADGGSPALWTGEITITSDYWVWDGSVGPVWDNTPGDYGFSFGSGLSQAFLIGTTGSSSSCGSATHNITIAHFYGKATSSDVEKEFEEGNTYGGALANVTFSNFLIDGWQGLFMTKSGACSSAPYTGWIVQYGVLLNGSSTSANHGEWINPNERALSGVIIRYNIFRGNSGNAGETGVIVANNSDNDNAAIYGNVFDNNLVGNGIITGTSQGNLNNAVIYNNTFLNMPSASGSALCGSGQGSGNVAYNNLFYNMSASVGGGCTTDYNAYFKTTNTPSEPHGQTSSVNPLVNVSAFDYHLAMETNNGLTLPSPYNIDVDGNARPGSDGIWSRGAYQYGTGTPPPPSPCDVNNDGVVNVVDVQLEVNMALGISPCTNPSGTCTVVSVQRVVNAALGGACVNP